MTETFADNSGDTSFHGKNYPHPVYIDPSDPIATARQLIKTTGLSIIFVSGNWLLWSAGVYQTISKQKVRSMIYAFLCDARTSGSNPGRIKPKKHLVQEVLDALEAISIADEIGDQRNGWFSQEGRPPSVEILACGNVLLHLPTRTPLDHTPAYYNLGKTGYDFDAGATHKPEFDRFLGSLRLSGDELRHLQELMGYGLWHGNPLQKLLMIIGPSRAGKGILIHLMSELIGAGDVAALHPRVDDRFELEHLLQKKVAILPDLRMQRSAVHSFVQTALNMTGHDLIQVRRKYTTASSSHLQMHLVVTSNEVPCFSDTGGAIAGRVIPLELRESFKNREDTTLKIKLQPELPAILNWCLDGYDRVRLRRRFELPTSSQRIADVLAIRSSPLQSFVEMKCTLAENLNEPKEVLWSAYRSFCDENGLAASGSQGQFTSQLMANYPVGNRKLRDGNAGRISVYSGIALKKQPSAQ